MNYLAAKKAKHSQSQSQPASSQTLQEASQQQPSQESQEPTTITAQVEVVEQQQVEQQVVTKISTNRVSFSENVRQGSRKRPRDSTSGSSTEEQQPSSKRRRSKKRSGTSSSTAKFSALIPTDLSDQDRLKELIKVISKHTSDHYCKKHDFVLKIHDQIIEQLMQFVEDNVNRWYGKAVIPNSKNTMLKVYEKHVELLLARFEEEERQWLSVASEIEGNLDNEQYLISDRKEILDAAAQESTITLDNEPSQSISTTTTTTTSTTAAVTDENLQISLHKRLHELMKHHSLLTDEIALYSTEISTLYHIALNHCNSTLSKVKESVSNSGSSTESISKNVTAILRNLQDDNSPEDSD
jgi:hypothetical protein